MKTIHYIFCFFCLLLASGCVPSPMYTLVDSPQGKVALHFDWWQTTPGATQPERLMLRFYPSDGNRNFAVPASASGFEGELPAGNYRMLAFQQTAEDMIIADSTDYTTACVYLQTHAATNEEVRTASWHFGVSCDELVVKQGVTTTVNLPVMQHVAPVSVRIKGTGLEYIRTLNGNLSSVASCVNLASGNTVTDRQSCCLFTFEEAESEKTASFLLLGTIPGAKNQLSILLTYTDGSSETLTHDMSAPLQHVNSRKHEPVLLECTVDINRQSGKFNAGIVKWEIVDMGEIVPNTTK